MKVVLSYLMAFGGLGVTLWAFTAVAGRRMYGEARAMIIQMLRMNPHQAEAICRVDKGSFLECCGAAFKTAVMMKSRDPAVVPQGTKPAYDAQCMQVKMHWKGIFKRVKTAGTLAIGAVVLAFASGATPILHIILLVGSIAGCAAVVVHKLDVDRSLLQARAEVLPEIERAIIEGRYVLPP